jgi:hypothetical protein
MHTLRFPLGIHLIHFLYSRRNLTRKAPPERKQETILAEEIPQQMVHLSENSAMNLNRFDHKTFSHEQMWN